MGLRSVAGTALVTNRKFQEFCRPLDPIAAIGAADVKMGNTFRRAVCASRTAQQG
jgi:hypothetical protein